MRLLGLLVSMTFAPLFGQSGIVNIKEFLRTCPNNDPAIATIRADFEIRNSGNLVANIACTEPFNEMDPTKLTTELVMLQSLRVMYYMDQGRSNYLPWTPLRLYDWVKSKIGGMNILNGSGSSCCSTINGKTFITVGTLNLLSLTGYQTFSGISGGIGLIGHESRHVDGFPHVSCCPAGPGACDQTYDEKNISPYGIQNYLARAWLSGSINVGFYCQYSNEIRTTSQFIFSEAQGGASRFCDTQPPAISSPQLSDIPGGPCSLRTLTLAPNALTNAANYNNMIWPGTITTIFGSNIGSPALTRGTVTNGVLGTSAGDTQTFFNGVPGPMIYSTKDQISAVAPFSLAAGGASVDGHTHVYIEVVNGGKMSTILDMALTFSSAALFTLDGSGNGQAAAVNQNGTINGPGNPVPRGQIITVFATGLGQTDPPQTDGEIVPLVEPFPRVTGSVQASIGGFNAVIQYVGAAPGVVAGLTQVNIFVPQIVTPGPAVPIVVSYGPNNQKVTIAVQ